MSGPFLQSLFRRQLTSCVQMKMSLLLSPLSFLPVSDS